LSGLTDDRCGSRAARRERSERLHRGRLLRWTQKDWSATLDLFENGVYSPGGPVHCE
jgi:hypothetical protein